MLILPLNTIHTVKADAGMLVASGTHGVVRILVGGYLLLQVPSRFDSCPLRHIRGYLSR